MLAAGITKMIRDVRQGPDGYLYLLTAENDGALPEVEVAGDLAAACAAGGALESAV